MYQSTHPLLVFVAHLPDELSCSPPVMLVQTGGCETYEADEYQYYNNIIPLSPFSDITTVEAFKKHEI
jgi:hypothetical protein